MEYIGELSLSLPLSLSLSSPTLRTLSPLTLPSYIFKCLESSEASPTPRQTQTQTSSEAAGSAKLRSLLVV